MYNVLIFQNTPKKATRKSMRASTLKPGKAANESSDDEDSEDQDEKKTQSRRLSGRQVQGMDHFISLPIFNSILQITFHQSSFLF